MSTNMNREHQFNIQFVGYISKHPCLFNTDSPEYKRKDIQDIAWSDVSRRCGEPEEQCRKRWRNLKTSTARYLKQLRTPHKRDEVKEYYLYEHIKFAIPFLKSKEDIVKSDTVKAQPVQTNTYKLREIPVKESGIKEYESSEEESYQYEIVESDTGYIVTRPEDGLITEDGHLDESNTDDQKEVAEQPPVKRQKMSMGDSRNVMSSSNITEIQEEIPIVCPDELFLKSILPDIALMTTDQKRKFKIGVLSLVDKILCP